jgi:hypothetical protein
VDCPPHCTSLLLLLLLQPFAVFLIRKVRVSGIAAGKIEKGRSRWPRDLRRGSAAARLLGLWVRIPSDAWMSVSCECCVLTGGHLVQRSPTECGVSECDRLQQ